METLRRVRHLFQRGDWLITIDIVSAYHNFLVHPEDQKFCGFFWLGIFYVYAALSFGSSAAPAIFQSLMDAIARYLRRRAVRCYHCRDVVDGPACLRGAGGAGAVL